MTYVFPMYLLQTSNKCIYVSKVSGVICIRFCQNFKNSKYESIFCHSTQIISSFLSLETTISKKIPQTRRLGSAEQFVSLQTSNTYPLDTEDPLFCEYTTAATNFKPFVARLHCKQRNENTRAHVHKN